MDKNVNPWVATIILGVFGALIVVAFWANGEAAGIDEPSHMHRDPSGNLYILVHNLLLQHAAEGEFTRTHDLSELGVESMVGDFAFFSNGDVLIRRGKYDPGMLRGWAIFMRQANTRAAVTESEQEGMFRCNLESATCVRFGHDALDFNETFHAYIDWRNDDVYIADTSRHVVRKFDHTGAPRGGKHDGLWFPNDVELFDDGLYVANTNHHRIDVLDASASRFGALLQSFDVVSTEAQLGRNIWPAYFARVGDRWWVNLMGNNMAKGNIVAFNSAWKFEQHIHLPGRVEPGAMLALANRVLVSDAKHDRIFQVGFDGKARDDFNSDGLRDVVGTLASQRAEFTRIYVGALVVFGLGFLLGVAVAVMQAEKASNTGPSNVEVMPPQVIEDDPSITWLTRRRSTYALHVVAGGLGPITGISLLLVLLINGQSLSDTAPLVPFAVAIMSMGFAILAMRKARVGVRGEQLVLRSHRGLIIAGSGAQIRHTDFFIAIGDEAVALGHATQRIFNETEFENLVRPKLTNAIQITAGQMQMLMLRRWHPHSWLLGALLLMAVGGVWMELAQ